MQEEINFDLEREWDEWNDSQIDGDNSTATKYELTQFFLKPRVGK